MKRYQPRQANGDWTVFDSKTAETLNAALGQRSEGGAAAYSELLNDLEAVGRSPAAADTPQEHER